MINAVVMTVLGMFLVLVSVVSFALYLDYSRVTFRRSAVRIASVVAFLPIVVVISSLGIEVVLRGILGII